MTSSTDFESTSGVPRGSRGCKTGVRAPSAANLAAMAAGRARRPVESADDYPHVVVVIDARHRVIECAHRIQWIIQKRSNTARNPWQGLYFCRTKEALLHYAKSNAPELLRLPDRFPERVAGAWDAMWARPFDKPELL